MQQMKLSLFDAALLALSIGGFFAIAAALYFITWRKPPTLHPRLGQALPRAAERGDDADDAALPRATKKQQLKDAKKRAKDEARQAREAAERARNDKSARAGAYGEKQRARAAEFEKRQRRAEEDSELREAEAERLRQQAEAARLAKIAARNEEELTRQIIGHIERNKVVQLMELATAFHLPFSEIVRRVEALEQQGRITGVVDDRGSFIYVTPVAMQAMAIYIHQHGRIGLSQLAADCGQFMALEGEPLALEDEEAEPLRQLEKGDGDVGDDAPSDLSDEVPPLAPSQALKSGVSGSSSRAGAEA